MNARYRHLRALAAKDLVGLRIKQQIAARERRDADGQIRHRRAVSLVCQHGGKRELSRESRRTACNIGGRLVCRGERSEYDVGIDVESLGASADAVAASTMTTATPPTHIFQTHLLNTIV